MRDDTSIMLRRLLESDDLGPLCRLTLVLALGGLLAALSQVPFEAIKKPNEDKPNEAERNEIHRQQTVIVKPIQPERPDDSSLSASIGNHSYARNLPLIEAQSHVSHRSAVDLVAATNRGDLGDVGREGQALATRPDFDKAAASLAQVFGDDERQSVFARSLVTNYALRSSSAGVRQSGNRVSHSDSVGRSISMRVERGDGLIKVLRNIHIPDEVIAGLTFSITDSDVLSLQPGDKIGIWWAEGEEHGSKTHVEQVSVFNEDREINRFVRRLDGSFQLLSDIVLPSELPPPAIKLSEAISLELMAAGVARDDVLSILKALWDRVDLNGYVVPGDALEIVLRREETVAIDYLSLTSNNQKVEAFRFQTANGSTRYYDRAGTLWGGGFIVAPMGFGRVTSDYGQRTHPISNVETLHTGRDLAAPSGTRIVAAQSGTVEVAEPTSSYGNMVEISHGLGFTTRYAHMDGFVEGLKAGDFVRKGQIIGYVGSTGRSTGSHLHFEVRQNNIPIDPLGATDRIAVEVDYLDRLRFETRVKQIDAIRSDPRLSESQHI